MENKIRNTLNEIYFGKTKDIVHGLRSTVSAAEQKQRDNLMSDLSSALKTKMQQPANWWADRPADQPRLIPHAFVLIMYNRSSAL